MHRAASEDVAALTKQVERWHDGIAGLDPGQLWTEGLSQATEIDAGAPFAHLVLHMSRELTHRGCEITVLRDLYRARVDRVSRRDAKGLRLAEDHRRVVSTGRGHGL